MADQAIGELIRAQNIGATDLFVLEQSGVAKSLTGQILMNWLVSFADGHGGIHSIEKKSSSGLTDTYRITLADTTVFDFTVTNGRSIIGTSKTDTSGLVDTYTITYNDGQPTTFTVTNGKSITGISKTGTSGLVDTYSITYNDGPATTFTVTNGAKGDKGDNAYVWIKYASQKPTEASHNMSDIPDNWIGIYTGSASTPPTDWTQYNWYKYQGDKGDTGDAAVVLSNIVEYMVSSSGTIVPSGSWTADIPIVPQGMYLWTRVTTTFNSGSAAVYYSVSRMGLDGSGSVSSVASISPQPDGNVPLTPENIGAVAQSNGFLTGDLDAGNFAVKNLKVPADDLDAVTKAYVDGGFAPAGYGLGGACTMIPDNAALDGYTSTGFYQWRGDNTDANKPFYAGSMLVVNRSDLYIHHLAFRDDVYNCEMCIRKNTNGVLGAWEWVNPTMAEGVEYRTIERYHGKPVYTKIVNTGVVVNGTVINLGLLYPFKIVRQTAAWLSGGIFLPFDTDVETTKLKINLFVDSGDWKCNVICGTKYAGKADITLQVWYTKD